MPIDLKELVTSRLGENYDLHERYINTTLVKVQRTIGFDKVSSLHASGAYLYDMDGKDYLDFPSGYSVYNIGRNHPAVKKAINGCAGDGSAKHGANGLLALGKRPPC